MSHSMYKTDVPINPPSHLFRHVGESRTLVIFSHCSAAAVCNSNRYDGNCWGIYLTGKSVVDPPQFFTNQFGGGVSSVVGKSFYKILQGRRMRLYNKDITIASFIFK